MVSLSGQSRALSSPPAASASSEGSDGRCRAVDGSQPSGAGVRFSRALHSLWLSRQESLACLSGRSVPKRSATQSPAPPLSRPLTTSSTFDVTCNSAWIDWVRVRCSGPRGLSQSHERTQLWTGPGLALLRCRPFRPCPSSPVESPIYFRGDVLFLETPSAPVAWVRSDADPVGPLVALVHFLGCVGSGILYLMNSFAIDSWTGSGLRQAIERDGWNRETSFCRPKVWRGLIKSPNTRKDGKTKWTPQAGTQQTTARNDTKQEA